MTDEEKIRLFEKDTLDTLYQGQEFYQYIDDIVIPYLLQVAGDIDRHRENLIQHGHSKISLQFYITNMMHGISHCIRWTKMQTRPKHYELSDSRKAQVMAAEFMNWGIAYHSIAQEFVMWSRGIKKAILEEETKRISFTLPDDYDYSKVFSKQLLYSDRLDEIYESYPHDDLESEFLKWLKSVDLNNPPILNSVDWTRPKKSPVYPKLLATFQELILPELPANTDLGGYSINQLRVFYTLFYFNFYFIRWVEAVIDAKRGVDHSFGSNPLYLSPTQLVSLAVLITDLPLDVVSSIITDLTFNHTSFHASITTQPFIQSNSGTFYILPNLFHLIEPSRMITGALNKGVKKKIYDSLINQIERLALSELTKAIKNTSNWLCLQQKTIKLGSKQIQPDFVIIDPDSKHLLIIDYKHFIGPTSASEVEYKIKELKKAILQVETYLQLISQLDNLGSTNIGGFTFHAMILTRDPLPIPIPTSTTINIFDTGSFKKYLLFKKENLNLNDFLSDLKIDTNNIQDTKFYNFNQEINVKDWTIVRKLFKSH